MTSIAISAIGNIKAKRETFKTEQFQKELNPNTDKKVRARNIRDEKGEWYVEDLAKAMEDSTPDESAQHPVPKVHRKNGKLVGIVDGNRRIGATILNFEKFPKGHTLIRTDPESGEESTFTKVYDSIEVDVYDDLTEAQVLELAIMEVGNRANLDKASLYKSDWRLIDEGFDEPARARLLNTALRVVFPRTIESEKKGRHAWFQLSERVFLMPDEIRRAWLAKQRGETNYPTDKNIKDLYDILKEKTSIENDPAGNFTRNKPPREVSELWDEIKEAAEEKKESGAKQAKKVGMMSRSQIEKLTHGRESRKVKVMLHSVIRTKGFNNDGLVPLVDKISAKEEEVVQHVLKKETVPQALLVEIDDLYQELNGKLGVSAGGSSKAEDERVVEEPPSAEAAE
jgi:hypothetical protein